MAECPDGVGHVINIGSGQQTSIQDLATTVLTLVGREIPIISDSERIRPEGSEVERLCADNGKARKVLHWQPQQTLESGLSCTIEWIRANLKQYQCGFYAI